MNQHFKTTVICLGIVLFIGTGTAFTLSEHVKDDEVVISTCDVSDFDGGSCTLTCTVTKIDDSSTVDSCSWKYYSDDENEAVTLYDGISFDDTTDYVVSLTLSTYNPGVYECELNKIDENMVSTSYNGSMSISGTNPGVYLNDACTASTDCFALNAACDTDKTCQCTGEYDITFTSDDNTPACLTHENEHDSCNIDDECEAENEDFKCENAVCTCEGTPSVPVEDEGGRLMCIDSEYLTSSCVYNEQCTLVVDNSECNDGACNCSSNYYIDKVVADDISTYICSAYTTTAPTTASTATSTTTEPVPSESSTEVDSPTFSPDSESMSGGAITGIVFAVLIGCGLIGAVGFTAFNIIQKRR